MLISERVTHEDRKERRHFLVDPSGSALSGRGMGRKRSSDLRIAFARSTFKAFANEGSKLIGCGRSIDDGRYHATLVDVVVAPAHQRQGIGRAIVEDLLSRMTDFVIVTTTVAPEVQPFYQRLGWHHQTTAMIFPRSKEQDRLNASAT